MMVVHVYACVVRFSLTLESDDLVYVCMCMSWMHVQCGAFFLSPH